MVCILRAGAADPFRIAALGLERHGIEMAGGGGNILPAIVEYKLFPGIEGSIHQYFGIPENPVNEWRVANHHYEQAKVPPDFFTVGGRAAGIAAAEALKKIRGDAATEKLVTDMEA